MGGGKISQKFKPGTLESRPNLHEKRSTPPRIISIRPHIYVCMHVCMYACIYVCIYVCIYINVYIHMYMYTYVYIYTYTRTYIYIHTHVHAYIHIRIWVQTATRCIRMRSNTLITEDLILSSLRPDSVRACVSVANLWYRALLGS